MLQESQKNIQTKLHEGKYPPSQANNKHTERSFYPGWQLTNLLSTWME